MTKIANLDFARGALTNYSSTTFPDGVLTNLWHLYVRDNPQMTAALSIDDMETLTD